MLQLPREGNLRVSLLDFVQVWIEIWWFTGDLLAQLIALSKLKVYTRLTYWWKVCTRCIAWVCMLI